MSFDEKHHKLALICPLLRNTFPPLFISHSMWVILNVNTLWLVSIFDWPFGKASHLTAFCAWDIYSSLHLLVTPALLMRPGVGRNASCTVGDFALNLLVSDSLIYLSILGFDWSDPMINNSIISNCTVKQYDLCQIPSNFPRLVQGLDYRICPTIGAIDILISQQK